MVKASEKLNEITKTLAEAGVFDPLFEAREILREYADGAMFAELSDAAREAIEAGYPRNEVYRAKLKIADMFEDE